MIVMSFAFAKRPVRRTRARVIPFEAGVSQGQMRAQRFTVSYYLIAMLFIVFDVEIVFFYPLGVQLHALGWFGFVELLFFVVIPSACSSSSAPSSSSKCDGPFVGQSSRSDWSP